ncbi:MAG: tRNA pseudouridine(38-40) synthase TruA [Gammaproteobacteria bacterium RIFCSPHIGHO2_12_FULL_45_12]|nr:MAG: tRNA pseudouridine(38-40) synthase TruA [Gammaproteobacteria bacterium RIFCSPHIGHO2_12_FULL_45_12]
MRVALGVEYNGHGFHGWQRQRQLPTIQGALEAALSKVANEPIKLFCAGRTDANVHAVGQVVHFDTHAKRHIDAWLWGSNSQLPDAIVVRWARQVDFHFHARFKASARRYRYILYNKPVPSAVMHGRVSWYGYPLNVEAMREAGQYLMGEQDFSSFRASECHSKSPMRRVTFFQVERHGDFIIFEIEANAFLHHMVRNIVGTLMKVGVGQQPPAWLRQVLEARCRQAAGATAPPFGLYLIRVDYPEPYIFPTSSSLFLI